GHTNDFRHAGYLSRTVAQSHHLNDYLDSGRGLLADHRFRQTDVGHQYERLYAMEAIPRRICVHGGHGAVVTGVHGLQHVERLGSTRFADDNAIRPHTKSVDHQISCCDSALALDIRCSSFEPRSEEHTSELQSRFDLVCRLLLE